MCIRDSAGKDGNGCQFFITCAKCEWLDDKHVVFGRVIGDGMLTLRKMEAVPVSGAANVPKLTVLISQCGEM